MRAIEAVYCKNCGKEKKFVECQICEGQGIADVDDDGFMVECPDCDGQGGILICPSCHPEAFGL